MMEDHGYMLEECGHMREGYMPGEGGYMPEECGYLPEVHSYMLYVICKVIWKAPHPSFRKSEMKTLTTHSRQTC
jgi:hypothetical protein